MKIWQNLIITIIFLTGIASSCRDSETGDGNTDSPRIVRNTKIISPKAGEKMTIGDMIHFEVGAREIEIDSIEVEFNGTSTMFQTNKFDWTPPEEKAGTQKIRVQVYYGELSETHYPKVVFLSDIKPTTYTYTIKNTFEHNTEAFTQGLFFIGDTLIESTGQRGESYLAKINEKTGEVYQRHNLPSQYFGEGSCLWNNKIIQLTYTSQKGFVYDKQFNEIGSFNYGYEGWGITAYNDMLYVSNGSQTIHLFNPNDFSEVGKVEVYDHEGPIDELNELEVIEGLIYANIWRSDMIIAFEPESGRVIKKIDLSGLLSNSEQQYADVLNGIAYNNTSKRLLVTGKLWPKLFEIELIEK